MPISAFGVALMTIMLLAYAVLCLRMAGAIEQIDEMRMDLIGCEHRIEKMTIELNKLKNETENGKEK